MTRIQYINKVIHALCGDSPARPDVYHLAVRMADGVATVFEFEKEILTLKRKQQ